MIAEPNPDRVRPASERDAGELLELCRRRHAEEGIGAFAPDKVLATFRRAFGAGCEGAGSCIIGVVGQERIEGSIGLVCETPWDSATMLLVTLWNYVLPEHRGSTHLKDLTAWAERLSHPAPVGQGLPLSISTVATRRTEARQRLYRRQMGEPALVTWVYEARGDWL